MAEKHRKPSWTVALAAALLLLALGARLLWTAAGTETGWQLLAQHWTGAALGWFGREEVPVHSRPPVEQAEFWLAEADRIIADHPASAELVMGAAWILDGPGIGFVSQHLREPERIHAIPVDFALHLAQPQLDYAAVEAAALRFEERCVARCLELAATATELEPDDPRWWRMRALLLFRSSMDGPSFEPRTDDWADVLEQAARHDPDNALYDALAALCHWTGSAEYHWEDEGYRLEIRDPERFERGTFHVERALQQPRLVVGRAGFPAVAALLERSSIPKRDRAELAASRLIDFRTTTLYMYLARWQMVRADDRRRSGDPAAAAEMTRQISRLTDLVLADNVWEGSGTPLHFREIVAVSLKRIAEEHPGMIAEGELAELRDMRLDARVERSVLAVAAERLGPVLDSSPLESSPGPQSAIPGAVGSSSAVLLFAGGLLGLLLAKLAGRDATQPTFGAARHVAAWIVAYGFVFVLFGMIPAGVVGADAFRFALFLAGCVGGAALFGWGVMKIRRRLRPPEGEPASAARAFWMIVGIWLAASGLLAAALSEFGLREALARGLARLFVTAPVAVSVLVFSMPAVVLFLWLRHRLKSAAGAGRLTRTRTELVGLLAVSTVVLLPAVALYLGLLYELVGRVDLPERGLGVFSPLFLRSAVRVESGSWTWAVWQWAAYPSIYVSMGLALGLVAAWWAVRAARARGERFGRLWLTGPRGKWGGLLACVSRSALGLAFCGLLVHLATAPSSLRSAEREYQRRMSFVRDPERFQNTVRQTIAEIESDPELIAQLRQDVQQRLAEEN